MAETTRINVDTDAPYEVLLGTGLSGELPGLVPEDAVRVAVLYPASLRALGEAIRATLAAGGREAHAVEIPDGEAAKTSDVAAFCWSVLGKGGFTRSDVVIGVGGGAATDLAGFVAATWLRGVRHVLIPTTVLGMVDAAVGGKTAIDTAEGKNLVGAFHEPVGVLCDLSLLSTLPVNEVRSGLAEVVKCGFIADPVILDRIEADPAAVLDVRSEVLRDVVERGIRVKASVVATDLTETGADGTIGREALNYGHTLAHAIERSVLIQPSAYAADNSALLDAIKANRDAGALFLIADFEDRCGPVDSHPPQPVPVLLVVVDEEADLRVGADVLHALQGRAGLRLGVDRRPHAIALHREAAHDDMGATVRAHGGQPADARRGQVRATARLVHALVRGSMSSSWSPAGA